VVVRRLDSGDYRAVVAAALAHWRRFAESTWRSEEVVLLDGCLYGYLTWSLFPLNVPIEVILGYVRQVEAIIRPLDPCLLYLHQTDVTGAQRTIYDQRGDDTERKFVQRATDNPYAKWVGLRGFDGTVAYWRNYKMLTDQAFAESRLTKLAEENAAGDWLARERRVLGFFDLPFVPARPCHFGAPQAPAWDLQVGEESDLMPHGNPGLTGQLERTGNGGRALHDR
jgi:hypothetical protein